MQVAVDEYLDKVVEKEEEEERPQAGIASAQDWGSSATPSKVIGKESFSWQENKRKHNIQLGGK